MKLKSFLVGASLAAFGLTIHAAKPTGSFVNSLPEKLDAKTQNGRNMKIQFIGTGAADWDWTLPLKSGVRGSSATLLDGRILIDAGPTVIFQMTQQGIDKSAITDVLITHSHEDHFNVANIEALAAAPRTGKLRVYSTKQALAHLSDSAEKIPLEFGKTITVGNFSVTPLPANHVVADVTEHAHHFLIDTQDGKHLLYALDGAWMLSSARGILTQQQPHIDMIIWDATSGNHFNDWRFADHNDLEMIRSMRVALKQLELIDDSTVHYFDHIARTLWPSNTAEQTQLEKEFNGILAHDGMIVEL